MPYGASRASIRRGIIFPRRRFLFLFFSHSWGSSARLVRSHLGARPDDRPGSTPRSPRSDPVLLGSLPRGAAAPPPATPKDSARGAARCSGSQSARRRWLRR